MEKEKPKDGTFACIKTQGTKTVGFETHEDGDKGEEQKFNLRISTSSPTHKEEEEGSFNPRGTTESQVSQQSLVSQKSAQWSQAEVVELSKQNLKYHQFRRRLGAVAPEKTKTLTKLLGTQDRLGMQDRLSHSSAPGEPEDTSLGALMPLAADVLSHSSSPGEPEDASLGMLKPRGSKSTRFCTNPHSLETMAVSISRIDQDVPDDASDSSDNLSYDASQVMGLGGPDEHHSENEHRPHRPVPTVVPSVVRPPQMSSLSQKSIHIWHRSRGRARDGAEQEESLSRVMNQVMTSQPDPPSTPQWPLLATGANRGKRRWVSKLCDTLSKQRAPHSTRVSLESVCLARELRAPQEQVTGLLADPRQRSAMLVTNRGFAKSVQLPKLHPDAKQSASDQGMRPRMDWRVQPHGLTVTQLEGIHPTPQTDLCHRFQERLLPSGNAPTTRIPARRKFHPSKPGWQPWRTHKLSAFDRT